jgi:hypothetical protein
MPVMRAGKRLAYGACEPLSHHKLRVFPHEERVIPRSSPLPQLAVREKITLRDSP